MSKNKTFARVASLLGKLQARLSVVGRETAQNTSAVATLKDDTAVKIAVLKADASKIWATTEERESKQALRDQNNVQSLVNLRDSTAKAFGQVKQDVETLMRQISELKSRITELENRPVAAVPAPQSLPSDHVWVNQKLTGVYEVCDEFETRLRILEAEHKLIQDFRAAQAAYLAGPKV